MKISSTLSLLLALALLSGCAYSTFSPYQGNAQRNPTSQGAFVNMDYGFPIYQGDPPRPYEVLGLISCSERAMSFEGVEHAAIRQAKPKGADALIQIQRDSRYSGSTGGWSAWGNGWNGGMFGTGWSQAQYQESANFVAIKFLN